VIPALRGCACPRSRGGWRRYVTPAGVVQCERCGGLRFPDRPPWRVSLAGGMVGRTYLERGEPVTVLAQWRGPGCPRNVVVADANGKTKVRPARGLRRP
jgi:acetyl esterase